MRTKYWLSLVAIIATPTLAETFPREEPRQNTELRTRIGEDGWLYLLSDESFSYYVRDIRREGATIYYTDATIQLPIGQNSSQKMTNVMEGRLNCDTGEQGILQEDAWETWEADAEEREWFCQLDPTALASATATPDPKPKLSGIEAELAKAIEKSLVEDRGAGCLRFGDMSRITFPLNIRRPYWRDLDPLLVGLSESGMIAIETVNQRSNTIDRVSITPAGRENKVWSGNSGFCIGRPSVLKIVRFMYADQGANENAAVVQYRWLLTDLKPWVKRSQFAGVAGATSEFEGEAQLQLWSDGWHAELGKMQPTSR